MNLVPITITALAESDAVGTEGKNIIIGAVVTLQTLSGTFVVMHDNAAGANPSTAKTTGAKGFVTVFVPIGEYQLFINGNARGRVVAADTAGFKNELAASGSPVVISGLPASHITSQVIAQSRNVTLQNVAKPTSISAAVGGSGVLTGAYSWVVTFVTANGETDCSGETPILNLSGQRALLSNISVSSSPEVIARRIYRTVAAPTDYVLKYLVGTINNNTDTTFEDNVPDAQLGAPVPRTNTTGGEFRLNGIKVGTIAGNTVVLGEYAHPSNAGYANTAIGNYALNKNTTGLRNTAVGVYAAYECTVGEQNTAMGVHAGNEGTTGSRNTSIGYGAAFNNVTGSDNTAIGNSAMQEAQGNTNRNTAVGSYALWLSQQELGTNTAVGYRAGAEGITPRNCVFVGAYAGSKMQGNDRLVIDSFERESEQDIFNKSLVYGLFSQSGASQFLKINGVIKSANAPFTGLPSETAAGGAINDNGAWYFSTGASSALDNAAIFYNGGALVGVISVEGGTTTMYQSLSDRRAKTNIVAATDALGTVNAVQVRQFDWIKSGVQVSHGVIAQELHEVYADAVRVGDDNSPWMVDNSKLVPLLIKAIQELSARIEALEAKP